MRIEKVYALYFYVKVHFSKNIDKTFKDRLFGDNDVLAAAVAVLYFAIALKEQAAHRLINKRNIQT